MTYSSENARRGQRKRAVTPFQQLESQLPFQRLNLRGNSRPGDMTFLRCLRKAAVTNNGAKILELTDHTGPSHSGNHGTRQTISVILPLYQKFGFFSLAACLFDCQRSDSDQCAVYLSCTLRTPRNTAHTGNALLGVCCFQILTRDCPGRTVFCAKSAAVTVCACLWNQAHTSAFFVRAVARNSRFFMRQSCAEFCENLF